MTTAGGGAPDTSFLRMKQKCFILVTVTNSLLAIESGIYQDGGAEYQA
jgi:hypothetical protein